MSRGDCVDYIAADKALMRAIFADGRSHLLEMDDELLAEFVARAADVLRDRGRDDDARALAACAYELTGEP